MKEKWPDGWTEKQLGCTSRAHPFFLIRAHAAHVLRFLTSPPTHTGQGVDPLGSGSGKMYLYVYISHISYGVAARSLHQTSKGACDRSRCRDRQISHVRIPAPHARLDKNRFCSLVLRTTLVCATWGARGRFATRCAWARSNSSASAEHPSSSQVFCSHPLSSRGNREGVLIALDAGVFAWQVVLQSPG